MPVFQKGHTLNRGRKLSETTKKKMSEAHKGVKKSPTHRRNMSLAQKGANSSNWNGGKKTDRFGYTHILSPGHPNYRIKYVPEHRLVMEAFLERFLDKKEVVHHINGNKSDNRIENLMLFPDNKTHIRYHNYIKKLLNLLRLHSALNLY